MYWYYKYPLLLILFLVLFGLGYLGFRSWFPPSDNDSGTEVVEVSGDPIAPVSGTEAPVIAEAKTGKIVSEGTPVAPVAPVAPSAGDAESVAGEPGPVVIPPEATPVDLGESAPFTELLALAQKQFDSGSLVASRELVWRALQMDDVVEYSKAWRRGVELLNKINRVLMNTAAPCAGKVRYVIQPGDSLNRIARKKGTTMMALQRVNELSKTSSTIHPGDSLLYFEGTWSIKVSKSQFCLNLYFNDKLYRVYEVGVGRQDRTPSGTFEISTKSMRPSWSPPGREPLPYGHPENIIGTRWLGLRAIEGTDTSIKGYGIHGTIEPESVGTPSSAGCIRLRNEEVEELFDFIPEPSQAKVRVTIVE